MILPDPIGNEDGVINELARSTKEFIHVGGSFPRITLIHPMNDAKVGVHLLVVNDLIDGDPQVTIARVLHEDQLN